MDDAARSPLPSPERVPPRLLKTTSQKSDALVSPAASLAASEAASEAGGLRKSLDRGLEKLRDRRRDSTDRDDAASSRSSSRRSGLSKLVPKRSLRRKKKKDNDGDSLLSVPKHGNSKLHLQSHNASTDSFGVARSPASSLLTDDSEPDLPSSRPDLVSRASHKGFLTFTSPLIPAEVIESNPPAERVVNPTARVTPSLKSPTDRPGSEQSSKPSIKVTTFPSDSRPDTPSTYITPPTPVLTSSAKHHRSKSSESPLPGVADSFRAPSSLPKESLAHRRVRSTTSAGKKGSFSSPLAPTVEEAKTPGGTAIHPSASSGFFAGFFTAAQNAATQISNSLTNPQASTRVRSGTQSSESRAKAAGDASGTRLVSDATSEKSLVPEPAIATLGQGNLSLTHLGISDHKSDNGDMATSTETAMGQTPRLGHNASASTEEASAADAVSAAYSNVEPSEKSVPVVTDPVPGRPRSISSNLAGTGGDQTPPRSLINTLDNDAGSILRAGSVRSRLSGHRKRRHNSSVAGAGAIAAAVAASNGVIANPANKRPVGFQVANSRSNKEFHQLFKSVPEDDHLIDDFSAALQRDILLHGRFYVSERHICFASNILGWVTQLVMSFDEVVLLDKKNTAVFFPNAIVIQTLHAKHVFASFLNRDPTYELLLRIWTIGHPNIKKTESGAHAIDDNGAPIKAETGEEGDSEDDDEDGSTDDEDESDGHHEIASSVGRPPSLHSEPAEANRQVSKASAAPGAAAAAATSGSPGKAADNGSPSGTPDAQDFPGPAQHAPTECTDGDTHFDKQCLDAVIPAPLGKVYSVLFGPRSGAAMRKFLVDDQKSGDLQLEDDKKGLGKENKSNTHSYIKPLFAPVGPRQTKCNVEQNLDAFDLEKAVSVTCLTSTPDVPSGNIFVVKTRYCLTWAAGNQTRLLMTATVEWSGKSWLRGPIEKGASDGQVQYGKDLVAFLKTEVASRSPAKGEKVKGKGKKKKKAAASSEETLSRAETRPAKQEASNWGPLQPLHDILSPIGSMAGDLVSPVSILSVLLLIVSILWIRQMGRSSGTDKVALPGIAMHQRLAAYDQLWKREESHLWDWLEARLEMDSVASAPVYSGNLKRDEDAEISGADMAERLHEKRMSERQVDEAIRTTEERLKQLKLIVERQRGEAL